MRLAPEHVPRADGESDQLTGQLWTRLPVAGRRIHERLVDDVTVDRRRSRDAPMGNVLPRALAVPRADGEEHAVVVREEQPAVGDCRRKLDERLRAEGPDARERRCELHAVGKPLALGVLAIRRPRDARFLRRGRRRSSAGRHELDRRRAVHVARLVLHAQVVGDTCADRDEDEQRKGDQDALHLACTAYSREYPCSSSRRPPPETGTYSPCGKSSTTRPLRTSTPRIRWANEPA